MRKKGRLNSAPDPASEQINKYNLNDLPPAPRTVSFRAALTILLTGRFYRYLLGFFFALPIAIATAPALTPIVTAAGSILYHEAGVWEPYAPGRVVSCEETDLSSEDRPILAIRFEGQCPDGAASFTGVSYSHSPMTPGDNVVVERRKGSADALRIKGDSTNIIGAPRSVDYLAMAVVLVFFGASAATFIGVIYCARGALSTINILKHGEKAYGSLHEIIKTNKSGQKYPVSIFTFNYVTSSLEESAVEVKTFYPEKLVDLPQYPLLYLPKRPQKACILHSLPKGIELKPEVGFVAKLLPLLPGLIFSVVFAALMIGEAVRLYKEPILKGRETLSSKTVIETANDANETQTQIVETEKSGN